MAKKRKKYRKKSQFTREPYWPRYRDHRARADRRKISFNLTYPEWLKIWSDSGHLKDSGKGRTKYCMSRNLDQGSYEVGNVTITTNLENYKNNYSRKTQSLSERRKRSRTIKRWWANKTKAERVAQAKAVSKSRIRLFHLARESASFESTVTVEARKDGSATVRESK